MTKHFKECFFILKYWLGFVEVSYFYSCNRPYPGFLPSLRLVLLTFLWWLLFFLHLTCGHSWRLSTCCCYFSVIYFLKTSILDIVLLATVFWSCLLSCIGSNGPMIFMLSLGYLNFTSIAVSLPLISLLFYSQIVFYLQFLCFSQWNYQLVCNKALKLNFK